MDETETIRQDDEAQDPDLPLVRRIGEGDREAFAQLVDRHLTRVHALAARLLGNTADAEDVAQEVFLRVWRHSATWRSGTAKYSTWMHRVTLNLCHDRQRRRRETELDGMDELPGNGPSQDEELQRKSVAARMRQAMSLLPVRQREALALCYYQGHGNIEAAEIMDVSVEALESLLSRGRRALRQMLRDEADNLTGEV